MWTDGTFSDPARSTQSHRTNQQGTDWLKHQALLVIFYRSRSCLGSTLNHDVRWRFESWVLGDDWNIFLLLCVPHWTQVQISIQGFKRQVTSLRVLNFISTVLYTGGWHSQRNPWRFCPNKIFWVRSPLWILRNRKAGHCEWSPRNTQECLM